MTSTPHFINEADTIMASKLQHLWMVRTRLFRNSSFYLGPTRFKSRLPRAKELNLPSRLLQAPYKRCFQSSAGNMQKIVVIKFIDRDGDETIVNAKVGDSLLDVAKDNDIDLEGACEGTMACSTCHVVFDPEQFKKLNLEPPCEEELDMLDLAFGLTDTSRLGCQVIVTEEMDGLILNIPVSVDLRDD